MGPVLVRAAALDRRGTVALGDHLKTPAVKVERGVGAVKLHAVAGIAADAVVVAFPHLIELDERPVRAVEWSTSQRAATETSGDRMKTSRLWLPWPPQPMSATRIVSLGAAASPRAVRTAGWSADQVAIPAVDAATRPEFSMKFRRLSSSLMGSSSGRTCLEIRVGNNEPRSHFGSNGALRGKQERGGQADMVWLPLRLAQSGPDHNMEADSAGSAADSTGRERTKWPGNEPRKDRTARPGCGGILGEPWRLPCSQASSSWRQEPGKGANGRGCQVAEDWLIRK